MLRPILFLAMTFAWAMAAAASEAPSPASAVNASYAIRPGDLVQITVWKEEEMDRELLVLPDGTVDFPLVGSLPIGGLTPAKAQDVIKAKLKDMIPAASVTVVVREPRGNSVSVLGQVTRPGDIIMTRSLSVMQALSQAGGLTTYADDNDIVILRKVDGKEVSIPFDYSDVSAGQQLETNIALEPGDVIVVPSASLFSL